MHCRHFLPPKKTIAFFRTEEKATLIVPWVDRSEEANERRRAKYTELVEEWQNREWQAKCEPVELGCRGFTGQSLCRAYNMLGITGGIGLLTRPVEFSSRWLWIKRFKK